MVLKGLPKTFKQQRTVAVQTLCVTSAALEATKPEPVYVSSGATCRQKKQQDNARGVSEASHREYALSDAELQMTDVKKRGLMVDTGATSHIITDFAKFKRFDARFQDGAHCGVAGQQRGTLL